MKVFFRKVIPIILGFLSVYLFSMVLVSLIEIMTHSQEYGDLYQNEWINFGANFPRN